MPSFVLLVQKRVGARGNEQKTILSLAGGPYEDRDEARQNLPSIKKSAATFRNGIDNTGLLIVDGELHNWNDL